MSFFQIFKSKKFTNKELLALGFVLAVFSMASLGLSVVLLPMFGLWMNMNGVMQMDFFFTAFIFTFLCATQALILFGFPMYYAQDQKSHMTALRILLCTLMWMVALMVFMGALFVEFEKPAEVPVENLESSTTDGGWAGDAGAPDTSTELAQ
jgi:hypothetical protein